MILNLKNLLVGHPVKLRYVYRFSTSRVQHPETVAEHSYYVCLYCTVIADYLRQRGEVVSVSQLLQRAVVHDLEEARSGDFPRPFKHSDADLEKQLEIASSKAMAQVEECFHGKADWMHRMWCTAKDDTIEGKILEFADFLSVLSFMHEEVSVGGNRSIQYHVAEMSKYLNKFRGSEYHFMRCLVDQAAALMEEVFDATHKI